MSYLNKNINSSYMAIPPPPVHWDSLCCCIIPHSHSQKQNSQKNFNSSQPFYFSSFNTQQQNTHNSQNQIYLVSTKRLNNGVVPWVRNVLQKVVKWPLPSHIMLHNEPQKRQHCKSPCLHRTNKPPSLSFIHNLG